LYWNKTDSGSVVLPFEEVGTDIVLFSVFTQAIVCTTAEKSSTHTSTICLLTAPDVVSVIVRVDAELFVTVFVLKVTGTVAAFAVAVIALFVHITCAKVWTPQNVW